MRHYDDDRTDGSGSDENWFERFRRGEKKAFKMLWDRHYRELAVFAVRILDDEDDADNIAIDCIVKAWKRHTSYESATYLRNWLFQTARNACVSGLRRRQTEIRARTELYHLESTAEVETALEMEKARIALLIRVFEELQRISPRGRDAVCYHYLGGLNDLECAKLLNTTPKNAALIRHRAIKKLRDRLKGDWPLALVFIFSNGL